MKETNFKHTDIGLIPYDWEVKVVSSVATNYTGLTYHPENVKEYGKLVLRSSNIQNSVLSFNNNVYVEMDVPDRAIAKLGDILICVRNGSPALIGKSALITEFADGMAFGAFMTVLRSYDIDNTYLLYAWRNDKTQEQIHETFGATINQITSKDFDRIKIPVPPTIDEQRRIAEALQNIDQLLDAMDAQIAKKQSIKTGAIQQLLTGKTRLAGFTESMEEKTIGEVVGKVCRGQSLQSKDFIHGYIPVVAGGKQYAGFHNIANHNNRTITISGSGANAGYVSLHNVPIFATDCSVIDESENFSLDYIFFLLQFNQANIYKMQTGGAQPHIYPKDVAAIRCNVTTSITEQKAIAEVLSNMDLEIQALQDERNKYALIKQGMMQELLTGKTRI